MVRIGGLVVPEGFHIYPLQELGVQISTKPAGFAARCFGVRNLLGLGAPENGLCLFWDFAVPSEKEGSLENIQKAPANVSAYPLHGLQKGKPFLKRLLKAKETNQDTNSFAHAELLHALGA